MKNVCIVGYGAIGPVHASALNGLNKAKLYAVCDIDERKRRLCEDKYGVITYSDFDEMLLDDNIDAVHICTPHYLHFPMIKKALQSGKAVVCEKPVTITKQEYNELISMENSDKVCMVLQNRLNACVEKFKSVSATLGKIKTVKGILTWQRNSGYYNSSDWRGKWATEGGGLLINQAVHTLDFFSYLIGDVKSVNAQMINFSVDEIEVEDTLAAYLTFDDGVKGVFFATNAYGDNTSPIFEAIYEKGILRYIDGKLFLNDELLCEDMKPEIGKDYWGSSHKKLFVDYYDNDVYIAPKDIKNTMYTMFAIYESAMKNRNEIEKGVTVEI